MMNFLVMELMQDILEKGELLQESALTDQKKKVSLHITGYADSI